MHLVKRVALGLLLLPVAEIAAFAAVASFVGFAMAFVLLIAVSLAGIALLRNLGAGAITRLRTGAGQAEIRSVNLDGAGIGAALGAILLIIPGFITGLLGALAIFPLGRKWLAMALRRVLMSGQPRSGPPIIDLEPDGWRQLPAPELPPRRRRPKSSSERA
jgi:UPF0716 protein FxsA